MSSICLEDYRCKLISKIAYSDTQQQVKRYLDAALKGLQTHRVNGHITLRFLHRVEQELQRYQPDDGDPLQWENVQAGQRYCTALLLQLQKS
ncbi:hypothetical protein [Flavihumibacter petaseus]|uniref:Uncharacterized protein n=1 Tax=Flavihumibacter petaseus NBRC 106054 TaxID=1220578 RepID=A0A0E9MZ73_9BACT|nr:hypothetical protein [Flavihumibacter petaseus]GAO42904.1 hypothetical protein FPE01S_02_00090 [Flavihumibacter petaseus NBRC 106054]